MATLGNRCRSPWSIDPDETSAVSSAPALRPQARPNSASTRAGSATPSHGDAGSPEPSASTSSQIHGEDTSRGRYSPAGNQPRPSLEVMNTPAPAGPRSTATAQCRPSTDESTAAS